MSEPIEMPFGLKTKVGSGNHVIGGVQIPHGKNFEAGEGTSHCKYYRVVVVFVVTWDIYLKFALNHFCKKMGTKKIKRLLWVNVPEKYTPVKSTKYG